MTESELRRVKKGTNLYYATIDGRIVRVRFHTAHEHEGVVYFEAIWVDDPPPLNMRPQTMGDYEWWTDDYEEASLLRLDRRMESGH